MRTQPTHNDHGVLTGFQVSNALLSRQRACRIAVAVPGARILRAPAPAFSFGAVPDDFCAFEVDGVPFLIIEPYGDSDRYWVVAEHPSTDARPQIERVRTAFETASAWL